MTDFATFATTCRTRIDRALMATLSNTPNLPLGEAMRYSTTSGGKRIRPILTYASFLALHGHTEDAALDTVACAIEVIHAYSLIHDDLPAMDDDKLRRGLPTCHIKFNEALAILAGDALQTLAFELLTTVDINPEIQIQLIKTLSGAAGAYGMVAGQAIDLASVNQHLTLSELEQMHRYKTGALIDASVRFGALVGQADNTSLTALSLYSQALGLAFQVQDDILDVTADTQTLGKQQGADAALNKPTYVSILGLDKAKTKAQDLCDEACDALSSFGNNALRLRQIARYVVERGH